MNKVYVISVWSSGRYFYGEWLVAAESKLAADQRIEEYKKKPKYKDCTFNIKEMDLIKEKPARQPRIFTEKEQQFMLDVIKKAQETTKELEEMRKIDPLDAFRRY